MTASIPRGPRLVPTSAPPPPVRQAVAHPRTARLTPWLFLLAPSLLLGVFTYIPVVNLFYYSVTIVGRARPAQVLRRAAQLPGDLPRPDVLPRLLREPLLLRGVVPADRRWPSTSRPC